MQAISMFSRKQKTQVVYPCFWCQCLTVTVAGPSYRVVKRRECHPFHISFLSRSDVIFLVDVDF